MSRVLISGGSQPLGLALTQRLVDQGHDVVVIGAEPIDIVPVPEGADYEICDLTRTRSVRALLGRHRPEVVVHLAFHRRPGHPREHRLNVDAARTLLRLSEAHGVRRVVHRSTAEVYQHSNDLPDVLREDQPLNLDPHAHAWIRQRVEADVAISTRMGLCDAMSIAVLRCAELLAPEMGSQLYDYLSSRACLRPMGFDPVVNVLSLEDAARAFALAATSEHEGPFNIPGADTLALTHLVRLWGRDDLPVPGPLLGPAYGLRRLVRRGTFLYGANRWRFHFNGILDGSRAERLLGYRPEVPMAWPHETGSGTKDQQR